MATPRSVIDAAVSTGAARILLAEDDSEMRELLALALRRTGHAVLLASDGMQLLSSLWRHCLADEAPDLIVTDVRMPGCSGLEVFEAARRACSLPIPVILITGFGDPVLHEKARRLGAVAVFDKPFDVDTLCCFVTDFTRKSRPSS